MQIQPDTLRHSLPPARLLTYMHDKHTCTTYHIQMVFLMMLETGRKRQELN